MRIGRIGKAGGRARVAGRCKDAGEAGGKVTQGVSEFQYSTYLETSKVVIYRSTISKYNQLTFLHYFIDS